MKKLIIYFIVITASLYGLSSCTKTLNLAPADYFGSGNFWQNEAEVSSYMAGIHEQLRTNYWNFWLLGAARGGTQRIGTSSESISLNYSNPIKNSNLSASNTGITNWSGFYTPIMNINLFIDEVQNHCTFLPAADRSYFLGQAYGLRAFYYFWLYRTYGGVPIIKEAKVMNGVTSAKDLYVARATPKQTLDFIKSDINTSITDFGSNTTIQQQKSYWSLAASLMLKGQVYLWSGCVTTGDQAPAAANADIITAKAALMKVTTMGFSLMPNFKDVIPEKGNQEIIMALRFADGEASNNFSQFNYLNGSFIGVDYGRDGKLITTDTLQLKGTGLQRNEYKRSFWETYDSLDTRRDVTFLEYYNPPGYLMGTVMKKFNGEVNSVGNRVYDSDIPIYRYAQTLLMLAECDNMLGQDPSMYINEVRARAYGANWDPAKYGYTDQGFAQNELAILHENDKEFVGENKRWFDVVRMRDGNGNSLAFSASANYPPTTPIIDPSQKYLLLWPVDINTLNGDPKLTQTPGY